MEPNKLSFLAWCDRFLPHWFTQPHDADQLEAAAHLERSAVMPYSWRRRSTEAAGRRR
ncbi:MAG: hypothetical protein QM775_16720 [Pirellulales bacterium]